MEQECIRDLNGNGDTFVFAPFMWEQIKMLKSERVQFAVLSAVVEYGCYGRFTPIGDVDPTGALEAMVSGIIAAIDRAKAARKRNQENGKRSKGAPKGSRNNPNGRRGTNPQLTETNQELTETNQELSYNVLMENDYMENDYMNLKEEKNIEVEQVQPLSNQRLDPSGIQSACAREKPLTVSDFNRLWAELPVEFQLSRGAAKNESAKKSRLKRVREWLSYFGTGAEALQILSGMMALYVDSPQARERPHNISHVDHFLDVSSILAAEYAAKTAPQTPIV